VYTYVVYFGKYKIIFDKGQVHNTLRDKSDAYFFGDDYFWKIGYLNNQMRHDIKVQPLNYTNPFSECE